MSVVLSPAGAVAQPVAQRSFPIQLFEPAMGTDTLLTLEPGTVAPHLGFSLGLWLNYQKDPLTLSVALPSGNPMLGGETSKMMSVVDHQLTTDLVGAVGLHHRWLKAQIGLHLPIHMMISGKSAQSEVGGELDATMVGDLHLQLKVALFANRRGFSLAFSPIITFPSSCLSAGRPCDEKGAYGGDPNLTFRPRFTADFRRERLIIAANLGLLVRQDSMFYSTTIGDRLLYGLGAGFDVHRRVQVMGELLGQIGFTAGGCRVADGGIEICDDPDAGSSDNFPMELALGGRFKVTHGVSLTGGLGVGLIRGIGSPAVRAFAGITWAPDYTDSDHDGVYDAQDQCPSMAEDRDGFQDEDGCPDPNNDGDLLPDAQDQCPDEAEDMDNFQDGDGCPDPDNDQDGILDGADKCPYEAENKNGIDDEDGCPDIPDKDNDGISNVYDKCPLEAEDIDNFQDSDGCPDPDNDEDGVPDSLDKCPDHAEDKDGYQDEDGCPDLDDDGDGVPNTKDRCPTKKETINGIMDHDGCPDRGRAKVLLKRDRLELIKPITFNKPRRKLPRAARKLLDQVALTLNANPQIKGIQIEVSPRRDVEGGREHALRHANMIRNYLMRGGVDGGRLKAVAAPEAQGTKMMVFFFYQKSP